MPSTGLMGVVADRVGALLRRARRARAASGTNWRAIGSCGSARVDQAGHRRRDRDRVARGDRAQAPACSSARHQGRDRPELGSTVRSVVHRGAASTCRSQGFTRQTGVHSTCSMRVRAGRQHHQPVEAERDAAGRRHLRQRGEEILVERIALAIDALPSPPSRPRSGGAARPGRSARRSRWRARRRRHRARSARRRADRRGFGRASAASATGYSSEDRRRGRCRGCGSIFSTSTRLNMSAQVSSAATRMPLPRRGGQRVAVGRRPPTVASRSMPAKRVERLGDGQPLRLGERIGRAAAEGERAGARPPPRRAASSAAQSSISAS